MIFWGIRFQNINHWHSESILTFLIPNPFKKSLVSVLLLDFPLFFNILVFIFLNILYFLSTKRFDLWEICKSICSLNKVYYPVFYPIFAHKIVPIQCSSCIFCPFLSSWVYRRPSSHDIYQRFFNFSANSEIINQFWIRNLGKRKFMVLIKWIFLIFFMIFPNS